MASLPAFKGIVHGKTIELTRESGLPDGQKVAVTVQAISHEEACTPGDGLRRAFGEWAEDGEELDRYLEWNRDQRKHGRPEIEP